MNTYPPTCSLGSRSRWFLPFFFSVLSTVTCGSTAPAQSNGSMPSKRPIGRLAGEVIYEDDLPAQVVGQLREARQHEYEVTIKALQELASQKLLTAEVNRKGVTAEKLLENEVDNKIGDPTPGEVEAFYLGQRDNRPFEEVKAALSQDLKRAKIQAARDVFLHSLQHGSELMVLLPRPRADISYDPARIKGTPEAPVMIIEFSDFSCPFCRQAESTLKLLADKYQGKVTLAYRDFPLRERHPQAQLAAEAARCAAEQSRFWEYHDLLFENSNRQTREDLLEMARKIVLEEKRFVSCMDSGKYRQQIEQDVQDATRIGVSVTPCFFINGIFLAGALPASAFEKIIDEELDASQKHAN